MGGCISFSTIKKLHNEAILQAWIGPIGKHVLRKCIEGCCYPIEANAFLLKSNMLAQAVIA